MPLLQLHRALHPLNTLVALLSVPLTFRVQHSWHQWMRFVVVDVLVILVLVQFTTIYSQPVPLSQPVLRVLHQIWRRDDNFLNVRQIPDIHHLCTLRFRLQTPALVHKPKATAMSRGPSYLKHLIQSYHNFVTNVTQNQKSRLILFLYSNQMSFCQNCVFIFWAASNYSK